MQLAGDLLGRPPWFGAVEHFGLARGELEVWMGMRFLDHVRDLPEDPDDVLAVEDRHGGDLDADTTAVAVHDHPPGVGRGRPADDLPCEELAGAARVLGCDDRREAAADGVTHPAASAL